jgi:Sigma-70 region 2
MDEPDAFVAQSPRGGTLLGEPLSFEAFFQAEARTLFRRLCAVTGNSAEAEEIMQDAFLAMWERWDRVGAIQNPTAYLYRTAMNVFRKRSRRAVLAFRPALSLAATVAPFSEIDEQQDVIAALEELTPAINDAEGEAIANFVDANSHADAMRSRIRDDEDGGRWAELVLGPAPPKGWTGPPWLSMTLA